MGEHTIFPSENFVFLCHCLAMVNVGVEFRAVHQVSNLRDALQLVVALMVQCHGVVGEGT
mgnify:CR=1 FL=1